MSNTVDTLHAGEQVGRTLTEALEAHVLFGKTIVNLLSGWDDAEDPGANLGYLSQEVDAGPNNGCAWGRFKLTSGVLLKHHNGSDWLVIAGEAIPNAIAGALLGIRMFRKGVTKEEIREGFEKAPSDLSVMKVLWAGPDSVVIPGEEQFVRFASALDLKFHSNLLPAANESPAHYGYDEALVLCRMLDRLVEELDERYGG